ncbi:carboxymuconolactone decarboxylase family protein [Nocardia sp. alder85J]|uniref:carboxymuconolactone decarboxylase family protein n=1 Tax=Nocardia sp. alder85J TaxID=2862949 RepID=UPI001CD4A301|nr:carboxymuconolactone decarboxylase family protein [Nocardia sp. alder85J]MCX4092512.1 carboxymuconolactone decarboxylase family protein [Nocardia sp. alder85J]
MARINPVAPEDWSEEMTTFITEFRTAVLGEELVQSRPGGANLLGTLAGYPKLAKAFLAFNGHFLYGCSLSDRQRELIILRVAHRRRCRYEWAQHVLLADDAGITAEEIARVTTGPKAAEWKPLESALLQATDDLLSRGTIARDTWSLLAAELDEHQLMDVVFTVGTYATVAMALRAFDIEPEPDLTPYLPTRR